MFAQHSKFQFKTFQVRSGLTPLLVPGHHELAERQVAVFVLVVLFEKYVHEF